MDLAGKIKLIGETQTFASGFRKSEIVLTTEEQYPQNILIEFTQNNIDLLNNLSVGESVKVSINIRGREWINPEGTAKYFNSINGWRIEQLGDANRPQQHSNDIEPAEPLTAFKTADNGDDDLPF